MATGYQTLNLGAERNATSHKDALEFINIGSGMVCLSGSFLLVHAIIQVNLIMNGKNRIINNQLIIITDLLFTRAEINMGTGAFAELSCGFRIDIHLHLPSDFLY